MKKLILMLFLVVGGVLSASADVYIKGSFDSWGDGIQLTGSGTLRGRLNLTGDIQFKLLDGGSWKGYNSMNYDVTTTSYISGKDDGNITLNVSKIGAGTYRFSATYDEGSSKWNLKIEKGNSESYTIRYVNGTNISPVNVYTFSDEECGVWPGTAMTKMDTYTVNGEDFDVYSYTFDALFAPEKVIFTDNKGFQTADLTFINGKTYGYQTYSVVGTGSIFSSDWDEEGTTNFMKSDGEGGYVYTLSNVELTAQDMALKVVKREGSTTNWYDGGDVALKIPADGIYDITVTSTSTLKTEESAVVTATATRITETAAVGTTGYGTFSSDYALDFTGITDIVPYRAEAASDGKVSMTKVTGKVPANTGLFIAGEANASVNVPTTIYTTSIGDNKLVATDGNDIAAGNYVFANQGGLGFYKLGSALSGVAKGKAYLDGSAVSSARLTISFDDEDDVTGIANVREVANNKQFFNLNGQRVAQPQKGLYIVNGKKMIMK